MSATRCFVSQSSYLAGITLTAGRAGRSLLGDTVLNGLLVATVGEDFFSARFSSGVRLSSSSSSERFCGIRGPNAGARGSPLDESCDELDPALRFSGSLPTSTRAGSVVAGIVFSMRRSGGEYCVPASTVRLTADGSGLGRGGVGSA